MLHRFKIETMSFTVFFEMRKALVALKLVVYIAKVAFI